MDTLSNDAVLLSSCATPAPSPGAALEQAKAISRQDLLSGDTSEQLTADGQAHFQKFVKQTCGSLSKGQVETQLAGTILLVSAVQEASTAAFLQTLQDVYTAVLGVLRTTKDPGLQQQLWNVVNALFSRLGSVVALPGVRKEASSMPGKLMALRPLQAEGEGPVAAAMMEALAAAMLALPSAFRLHAQSIEEDATRLLLASGSPWAVRQAAARCLAHCPLIQGDAAAWAAHAHRVLASLHCELDAAFLGLEDEGLAEAARQALLPAVQPFAPRSGPAMSTQAHAAAMSRVAGLLDCLECLLTGSFPAAVPLPCAAIMLLTARMLAVTPAAPALTGRTPASSLAFVQLLARLPLLHSAALQLLQQLLRAGRSALVPHLGAAGRLLLDQIQRINAGVRTPWPVRVQVYAAATTLLAVGGHVAARALLPTALPCARKELLQSHPSPPVDPEHAGDAGVMPAAKKRKKAKQGGDPLPGLAEAAPGSDIKSGAPAARGVTAQAGALGLLEALLRAGGASFSAEARAEADALVVAVAARAAAAVQELTGEPQGALAVWAAGTLQLAALRALEASVLTPARHRPPFLPQALRLFHQGLCANDPSVAVVCLRAAAACELLLHPSVPPLAPPAPGPGQPGMGMDLLDRGAFVGQPRLWYSVQPQVPAAPGLHAQATATQAGSAAADAGGQALQLSPPGDPAGRSTEAATEDADGADVHRNGGHGPVGGGRQEPADVDVRPAPADSSGVAAPAPGALFPADRVSRNSTEGPPAGAREERQYTEMAEHVESVVKALPVGVRPHGDPGIADVVPPPARAGLQNDKSPAASERPVPPARPVAFADESSDSEGSLPEIDSGPSDEDE